MTYLCTPYPDELVLSRGWISPQFRMSIKYKTNRTRRHRGSTHRQVQGTRAELARARRCRARAHLGFVSTYGFVLQDKQHSKACATMEAPRGRYSV